METKFKIDGLDIVGQNTRISFPTYDRSENKIERDIQMSSICAFLNGQKNNSELAKEGLLKNMLYQIESCIEDPNNVDWPTLLNSWKRRIETKLRGGGI
jgi:hypothetical protein